MFFDARNQRKSELSRILLTIILHWSGYFQMFGLFNKSLFFNDFNEIHRFF